MDRLLTQLVNNVPDTMLIPDREGIICFWNSGAEQMFGYTAAEAVGQSLDLKKSQRTLNSDITRGVSDLTS